MSIRDYIYKDWADAQRTAEWWGFEPNFELFEEDFEQFEAEIIEFLQSFYRVIDPATRERKKPRYTYDGWYNAFLKAEDKGFAIDCDVFEVDTDLIEGEILNYLGKYYQVIDPETGESMLEEGGQS